MTLHAVAVSRGINPAAELATRTGGSIGFASEAAQLVSYYGVLRCGGLLPHHVAAEHSRAAALLRVLDKGEGGHRHPGRDGVRPVPSGLSVNDQFPATTLPGHIEAIWRADTERSLYRPDPGDSPPGRIR